jgi:hypothetical protein
MAVLVTAIYVYDVVEHCRRGWSGQARAISFGSRCSEKFVILRSGWRGSHAENLDGCDRDLVGIGNGRLQQMRDSRPLTEDVQDRRWNKRDVKPPGDIDVPAAIRRAPQ